MATIEDTIKDTHSTADSIGVFKKDPAFIKEVFAPLSAAGFKDFNWVGAGGNSFLVSPSDNDQIIFRVTTERDSRSDNTPFFLASAYEHNVWHPVLREEIRLELLLKGKKEIPDKEKEFLLNEMKLAGWNPQTIENKEHFWKDVVMVSLRDNNGRVKSVPIISDPSALFNHLASSWPSQKEKADGTLEPVKFNICSSNYITMQDQAAAYNAAIESDARLKKLIPNRVGFAETEVMPVKAIQLS